MSTKMYLVYIDESYDETHFAYWAIFVPAFEWNRCFEHLLSWRGDWYKKHSIPLDYELHATKFVGGRGEHPANRDKVYRADLFYESIGRIERIEGIHVINAITGVKKKHMTLFEWMLNRINMKLEKDDAYGILICDEGNENKLTSAVRKMKKQNLIPQRVEYAGFGSYFDIPLERIVEDPLFKTSKSSYFIQLADFVAFSLLRNEKPLEGSTLEPVRDAFNQLDQILVKQAFGRDPKQKGIIRV